MIIDLSPTPRGFLRADFTDRNGNACSIQESSVATEDLLWLGCNEGEHLQGKCLARMHLTRDMAASLAHLLLRFADSGVLREHDGRTEGGQP